MLCKMALKGKRQQTLWVHVLQKLHTFANMIQLTLCFWFRKNRAGASWILGVSMDSYEWMLEILGSTALFFFISMDSCISIDSLDIHGIRPEPSISHGWAQTCSDQLGDLVKAWLCNWLQELESSPSILGTKGLVKPRMNLTLCRALMFHQIFCKGWLFSLTRLT